MPSRRINDFIQKGNRKQNELCSGQTWRAPAVGLVLVEPHVPLGEGTGEWRDQGHRGPGGPQIVLARGFSRSTSAARNIKAFGQERMITTLRKLAVPKDKAN